METDDPIETCKRNIEYLFQKIETIIKEIGETPLTRADRENISNFEINYKNFQNRTSSSMPDVEAAVTSARHAAIHASAFGSSLAGQKKHNEVTRDNAIQLAEAASNFMSLIDTGETFTKPYKLTVNQQNKPDSASDGISLSVLEKKIIELQTKFRSELETFERDIAKGSDEIEKIKYRSSENTKRSLDEVETLRYTIDQLKLEISKIQENFTTESEKAKKISKDAEEQTQKVNSQIDELLGQSASKVLLIDYANTAETEKKSADLMRNFSLFCMALTGLVLCLALYESLNSGIDWKQAIFKAFTAIALSVPAAYLARESAKHRNQEHINRRISLDLRAITPYIATLPNEEQNKIKMEVASKIFGKQENENSATDNYPINIQEIAKLIIEKIPTQR